MSKVEITSDVITEAGHDEADCGMVRALCAHLDCEPGDLTKESHDNYGLAVYSMGKQEYAIGTDSEATDAAKENIKQSLWAFKSEFIVSECDLPYELAEVFEGFQSEKCESANDAIEALIEQTCGLDSFCEAAISADGRGHFMSSYDGEENEEGEYFIYRLN